MKGFDVTKHSYTIIFGLCSALLSLGIRAQTPAPPDTVKVDAGRVAMYKSLFSKSWSEKFVDLWNSNSDTAMVLARMGKVYFVSVDTDTTVVLMNFDSTGKAQYLKTLNRLPKDSIPSFTAKLEKWAAFMEGKFGAMTGVFTGRIRFNGS